MDLMYLMSGYPASLAPLSQGGAYIKYIKSIKSDAPFSA